MPFDFEEYKIKCASLSLSALQKEHESYTRQIAGGSTSTAVSILAAPFTGGISLVGLGFSTPRIHNARKKLEIIEYCMAKLENSPTTRKRDVLGSVALSSVISFLTLGLASGLGDAVVQVGVDEGICALASNPETVGNVAHVAADIGAGAVEHAEHKHAQKKGHKQLERQRLLMRRESRIKPGVEIRIGHHESPKRLSGSASTPAVKVGLLFIILLAMLLCIWFFTSRYYSI